MRRVLIGLVALACLTVGAATSAVGQEFGDPEFGPLRINPASGVPGDLVDGTVDTAVVAENCITDPAVVVERFGQIYQLYTGSGPPPGQWQLDWVNQSPLIGIDPADAVATLEAAFGPFWSFLYPEPPGGFTLGQWAAIITEQFFQSDGELFVTDRQQQAAFNLTWLMSFVGGGDLEAAAAILERTFVLTFADIETQELLGELSAFDPGTGFGQVTVPDLAPGQYAVAAACVEPAVTDDSFLAAVSAGAAYLDSIGAPPTANPASCVDDPGPAAPSDCSEHGGRVAEGIAAAMLPEFVQPQAGPWVELFCVSCDPLPSANDVATFCGILPGVQAVPDRLATLFAGVDIDNAATYPSVEALEALVTDVKALLDSGDTSVPETVRPQWLIATEELRELVFGLTAVGFDFQLVVDFAPDQAQRLIDEGSGGGEPDPEFDAAVEVLTAFFLDNCVAPGGPGGEAGPATPTAAVARFTG